MSEIERVVLALKHYLLANAQNEREMRYAIDRNDAAGVTQQMRRGNEILRGTAANIIAMIKEGKGT